VISRASRILLGDPAWAMLTLRLSRQMHQDQYAIRCLQSQLCLLEEAVHALKQQLDTMVHDAEGPLSAERLALHRVAGVNLENVRRAVGGGRHLMALLPAEEPFWFDMMLERDPATGAPLWTPEPPQRCRA
jgi:hypothetical protein